MNVLRCLPMLLASAAVAPLVVAATNLPVSNAMEQSGEVLLVDLPRLLGVPSLASAATARHGAEPRLLWLTDDAVDDASTAAKVQEAFADGRPVLVIRGNPTPERTEALARLFGAASAAPVVAYVRTPSGLEAIALETFSGEDVRAGVQVAELIMLLEQTLDGRARARRMAEEKNSDEASGRALMSFNATSVGDVPGNHLTLISDIARNITPTSARLIVANKTRHILASPLMSADIWSVRIPQRYVTMHAVEAFAPGAGGVDPVYVVPALSDWAPRGSSATTFNISESLDVGLNFGLSVSPELGLSGTPSAKVGFNASFGLRLDRKYQLNYQVTDYALGTWAGRQSLADWGSPGPVEPRQLIRWTHELSPHVSNVNTYFFTPFVDPASKVTPSMRSMAPESASVWDVPDEADALINVYAGSMVQDVVLVPVGRGTIQPAGSKLLVQWTVLPSSPYLTREPTVLLRSKSGRGRCLVDSLQEPGALTMADCDAVQAPTTLQAQWQLDNFNRYYNRGTRQCLTLGEANGPGDARALNTQPCAVRNDQVWHWSADRIVSDYNGGEDGYLVELGDDGQVRAVPQPENLLIPDNPFHRLLDPWTTYPRAPQPGDMIEGLKGASRPLPPAWLQLPSVRAARRWDIVLLRQASGT